MTGPVVVSAPGKLVILGEYLVLEGGPCLVAAINRRARVTLRPASGTEGRISAWMPNNLQRQFAPGQPSQLILVDQLREALGWMDRMFEADLDTRDFFDPASGEKLGVGSSAALSSALWAALQVAFGTPGKALVHAELDQLREVLQGGGGSGVDLAASFAGGLQRFQRGPGAAGAQLEALDWPPEVGFVVVFSGHGAVTADFVSRFRAWRADAGAAGDRLMARMSSAASDGCEAAAEGQGSGLIEALDRYGGLMAELGEAIGKLVMTPTHQALADIARGLGGAYKPSGAGGGDIGIGGFTDRRALLAFRREVDALGLSAPELSIDPRGLTLEQQDI